MRKIFLLIAYIILLGSTTAVNAVGVLIRSNSMSKDIYADVILPKQYVKQPTTNFPVLYLLHGASDKYDVWRRYIPSIEDLATHYNMIIVSPDAEYSWYLDAPKSPASKYETYISSEIVNYMDANYRTIANRNGRAITGISMGGHGASYIALRHKDTYGTFGAMSGGLDYAESSLSGYWNGWNLITLLGNWSYESWYPYTALAQLDKPIKDGDYKIILHCGTNDFFINGNRKFVNKLKSKGITYSYTETPGQGHEWRYWVSIIEDQLKFFNNFFGNGIYVPEPEYCTPPMHDYDTYALNQYVEEINVKIGRPKKNLHRQSSPGVFQTLNVLPNINLKAGSKFNLEWKDAKIGTSSTDNCRLQIYLDKNKDLKFTEDELIKVFGELNTMNNTEVANNRLDIVLPLELTEGETRLRMFYEQAYFPSPADGCSRTSRRVYDIPITIIPTGSSVEITKSENRQPYTFNSQTSKLILEDGVTSITVYSADGKQRLQSSEKTISLSNYPKGVYIVSVLKGAVKYNSVLLY
ncbi:MAG: alpha/beta hydrolase-fold protein [Bacteroidales bacterium]